MSKERNVRRKGCEEKDEKGMGREGNVRRKRCLMSREKMPRGGCQEIVSGESDVRRKISGERSQDVIRKRCQEMGMSREMVRF